MGYEGAWNMLEYITLHMAEILKTFYFENFKHKQEYSKALVPSLSQKIVPYMPSILLNVSLYVNIERR